MYAHPSVLDHARTLYESRPVGPFTFKGKSEPMTLYEVGAELGPRSRSERDALPMVGRAPELALLQDALDRLRERPRRRDHRARSAGLGKSRLVQEAFATAATARLDVRAEPYGATTPYRPFRDPIRRLLEVERDESAAMTAALLGTLERVAPACFRSPRSSAPWPTSRSRRRRRPRPSPTTTAPTEPPTS